MGTDDTFKEGARIKWYRTPLDREVLAKLTKRSDFRGFVQVLGHLGLAAGTGTLAFIIYKQISTTTWMWAVPLLLVAMFLHGTVCCFFGGTACHELGHWTVFKTKRLNAIFLRICAFLGWWDHVWFRPSHFKHHQVTTHHDYDGEVVLPQHLSFRSWRFWLSLLGWYPMSTWWAITGFRKRAMGQMDNKWYAFVLPEDNEALRREHRNAARWHLGIHALLAAIFILSGNWILVFLVNFCSHYCGWLSFLCGTSQHFGMQPDVADHRRCCRTFLTRGLPAFLYWNMQYHIEHHMYPAVPFFNLPKLRKALEHDLPPAPCGLKATWMEMLEISRKQKDSPDYYFEPELPQTVATETASVNDLAREMAVN